MSLEEFLVFSISTMRYTYIFNIYLHNFISSRDRENTGLSIEVLFKSYVLLQQRLCQPRRLTQNLIRTSSTDIDDFWTGFSRRRDVRCTSRARAWTKPSSSATPTCSLA